MIVVLVQPVGEPLQALGLARVHVGVALGVVADQHLGEVRVELLDVGAELLAVLEVELVLAGLLNHVPRRFRIGRHVDVRELHFVGLQEVLEIGRAHV